jgi:TATA-box binding protein (TBP) (component of TFIID and TFIIIB)
MTELEMPTAPPPLDPLKLVTMTISADIEQCFNLDVISRYTNLDETIVGIHYRDIHRGHGMKDEDDADAVSEGTDSTKSGRFKNQCTFAIFDGQKIINTKLFNNGKMVNVGCKHPEQAVFTAKQILARFKNMRGPVTYLIPQTLKGKSMKELKKFFKDDLRKKFGAVIPLLTERVGLKTDLNCFSSSLNADESFEMFAQKCEQDATFVKDILHIFAIISILKCYFHEQQLEKHFHTRNFQFILSAIIENTNDDTSSITYDFPAYLSDEEDLIKFNQETVKTVLINKSTKCGYFINRTDLQKILERQAQIVQCKFDKSKYPGVLAQFRTSDGKIIKIIVFNTGKINITAASTHEQVQEGYHFIEYICHAFFDDLLLKCEYFNKKKEYEDNLPDQQFVGCINDQSYYLLNKVRILSNPRNVRCLHTLGILDKYR